MPAKVTYDGTPNVDLVKGMHTRWVVSQERNGADEVNMGICYHDADMADLNWDQAIDEVFYCAKGKLKILWDDRKTGKSGEFVANEGEAIFLPRGFHYILRATGVPSINVFTHKGRMLSNRPEYSKQLAQMAQM